jgi:hypothetical protein
MILDSFNLSEKDFLCCFQFLSHFQCLSLEHYYIYNHVFDRAYFGLHLPYQLILLGDPSLDHLYIPVHILEGGFELFYFLFVSGSNMIEALVGLSPDIRFYNLHLIMQLAYLQIFLIQSFF